VGVVLTAADISSRFAPPPVSEVLRELSAIRAGAAFAQQPQHLQAKYWQVTAALEQEAGDDARMRDAVREWRRLTPRDVDAQLRLHLGLVQLATSDAERLEHMHTLRKLAERPGLGPLFSRERLGRLSVLRDVFWAIPALADASSPYANAIIEEAFAAYGLWLYGRPIEVNSGCICFLAAWKGRGHLSWSDDGTRRVQGLAIPDDLLPEFLGAIENLKLSDAMREMSAFLDANVAPPLAQGDEITGETRLVVGGGASLLPVLATNVDGQSLGARGAAYCHPNPTVAGAPATTLPFDLLVVDRTFGSPSRDVVEAWELDASPSAGMKRLEFDSFAAAGRLSVDSLQDALLGCRRALVFSHVNNPTFHGGQGGILLGGGQHLSPEAIAPMALRGLQELVIIGCGSGRDNLFVGGVSVAHAVAVAGAREVLYTRWTITSEAGANFAVALMDARRNGMALESFLASTYAGDPALASVYGMIRP
jgi:CHAT domain